MNYYIVTGASKGLGEAIVRELFKEENTIIGISRTINKQLVDDANNNAVPFYSEMCDLADEKTITKLMNRVFSFIDENKAESVTLIQNAGVIDPIKPVGKMDEQELIQNVHVNLLAPMIISNQFVQKFQSYKGKKVIVHITSGAANRTVHGWSSYCSTKAGLDMFTKTFAFEQYKESYPVKVISFSPGVMDTDMQKVIRSSSEEDFQDLKTFQKYFENGMLRSPDLIASKLIELLNSNFESGKIYNIKEMLP